MSDNFSVGQERDLMFYQNSLLKDDLTATKAALARAVEVLEFYATAWDGHPGDSGPGGNYPAEPEWNPEEALLEDGGKRAREFLADRTAQAAGWQAIETVPRDGQYIWLANTKHVRVGFWNKADGEWHDLCRAESTGPRALLFKPTHWQPAPSPPKEPS